MKHTRLITAAFAVAALALLVPWFTSAQEPTSSLFSCRLHPMIEEEAAGTCPVCGLDLTPKPAEAAAPPAGAHAHHAHGVDVSQAKPASAGEDTKPLTIDPVVVQNMGLRIKPVQRQPIFRHIRAIGTVDVAESEISVVNLRYSGWVERIYVDETGVQVKKGQPLFDLYSPELVSAQEEYLLALRTGATSSALVNSARRRLELFGITAWHIEQIRKSGRPLRTLHVAAPRGGYVLHKNVVQGARVRSGADLYRIGNLAKIWVNAEIYEFDAPWVEQGARATMELSFMQGKTYRGTVAYIYPTLNPKTRTLTVRLEFDNPGLALKPGMFATVQIEAQRRENVVTVPSEAIIHSGTRRLVFVAVALGRYEAREVTTGLVGDDYTTEVLEGLTPGERVVVSGQFLLDSESQLQEAVQKLLAARLHARDPGAKQAAPTEGGLAESYWTCGMHPQIAQDGPGTCPICGMDLTEKSR